QGHAIANGRGRDWQRIGDRRPLEDVDLADDDLVEDGIVAVDAIEDDVLDVAALQHRGNDVVEMIGHAGERGVMREMPQDLIDLAKDQGEEETIRHRALVQKRNGPAKAGPPYTRILVAGLGEQRGDIFLLAFWPSRVPQAAARIDELVHAIRGCGDLLRRHAL